MKVFDNELWNQSISATNTEIFHIQIRRVKKRKIISYIHFKAIYVDTELRNYEVAKIFLLLIF